ncbi:MAG: hypothetical protein M1396_04935 [Chloroflexi bacterium]|nr:hypothetical protein [Chloroflexota bacterium]MCL5946409.1 hypothetical protein [Chloroflexota bacterium]
MELSVIVLLIALGQRGGGRHTAFTIAVSVLSLPLEHIAAFAPAGSCFSTHEDIGY